MISVEEARKLVVAQAFELAIEEVGIENASGRVLAEEVRADRDYPPFNRAAMDGFALRAAEFQGPSLKKVAGKLFAGDFPEKDFGEGEVLKIMTGAPVPAPFDAVVRVEDTEMQGEQVKIKLDKVHPWQNIARQGEDLRQGEEALSAGTLIAPPEIALLASLGKRNLKVFKSPSVVVISTGSEIKAVGEAVLPHQIRNSNGPVLEAFFRQLQVDRLQQYLVPDEPALLKETIKKAIEADIVVLSGGVSMGEADDVSGVLAAMGVQKIFHKVKLKPGKPIWFGRKENGPVVFGLPGNPFSSQVTFKFFIEPFLRKCFKADEIKPVYLKAAFERKKSHPMEEYFPCRLNFNSGETQLEVCPYNGSGDITATAQSHGLAMQPADVALVGPGDLLAFYFWKTPY